MSRKILKVGTDIITLNDKLVSVKEDYPFWKVNLNTSEQYWSALFDDNKPLQTVTLNENAGNITNFGSNYSIGLITAPNGFLYSIPFDGTSIAKINPDTYNTQLLGTISGAAKFSGAVLVGDYIYMIPHTASYILKFDTKTDTFTTFGSFGATARKFGSPCYANNGKIYASPQGAAQWLIIDPQNNDNITLVFQPTGGGLTGGCIDGQNGFIYSCPDSANNVQNWTKLNVSNNSISMYRGSGNIAFFKAPAFNINGIIFFYSTCNGNNVFEDIGITMVNTNNNDAITFLNFGTVNSKYRGAALGLDGFMYFQTCGNDFTSFRINPYNLTAEQFRTSGTGLLGWGGGAVAKNGKIFFIPYTASTKLAVVENTYIGEVKDNRILSRLTNKV